MTRAHVFGSRVDSSTASLSNPIPLPVRMPIAAANSAAAYSHTLLVRGLRSPGRSGSSPAPGGSGGWCAPYSAAATNTIRCQ
ncbi:MAG: hypothetical protein CSB46_05820 [Micrococcales bacterium]|nr:MAG: hypothetical protein CSB46_05820 [Micrococcales bacterium]